MHHIFWWIGIFKINSIPATSIRWLLCAVALMPVAFPATAAIYAVGTEPGCTHTSIQAAINAANGNFEPDFIRIPHSQVWNNQALVINTSQDLTLEGFWSDCNTIDTSGTRTTLDGAGGSAASVLRITAAAGTQVNLQVLLIRNGDASPFDGEGGGIRYQGSGVLALSDTSVINSSASKGGGIYANGNVDTARLVIGRNVGITGNTASRDGGGVFVNGMKLEMTEPNSNSIIAFNKALGDGGSKGYGGGVAVRSTGNREAIAFIGSAGVGTLGAIHGNEAKWGGGVAVSAGEDADADAALRLYTTAADKPGAITGNFASEGGGAIYLWPNRSIADIGFAEADLFRAQLIDNGAPEGATVYVDNSSASAGFTVGGELSLLATGNSFAPMPGALPCLPNTHCNVISGNIAERADGTDTQGSLIYIDDESRVEARRVLIERNQVGYALGGDSDSVAILKDAAIVGNVFRLRPLAFASGSYLEIEDSTITDNVVPESQVIAADFGSTILRRSIIWQPDKTTLVNTGSGAVTVESVVASEVASLNAGLNAIIANPRFIDPARGDYRLRAASRAIDHAEPIVGDDRDAFGLPRDQRIGIVPRPAGRVRDVGAFERQGLLPIVLNGDFDGDLNQWFLPVGHSGNYQTITAPGSTGGSAQVANLTPSSAPRLLGFAQCIHIPGPGTYALNGSARSGGSNANEFNRTALIWELRSDGGEGCVDGPIFLGGEHTLNTTNAWDRPEQPARITVSEVAWTANTSLTLILAVYPNVAGTFNGVFDRITLEVAPPVPTDFIFRDGFEQP
jgi:predicted outer membrane repeat protein